MLLGRGAWTSLCRSSASSLPLWRSAGTVASEGLPTMSLHPEEALESSFASGWAPPLGTLSDLPFTFARTENSQLPVYHRRRKHNTQFLTVVRKYRGDPSAIEAGLRGLLGPKAKIKRYEGRIEILGDHRDPVRNWMRQLGF